MRLLLNIALLLAFVLIPAVLSANVDLDKLDLVKFSISEGEEKTVQYNNVEYRVLADSVSEDEVRLTFLPDNYAIAVGKEQSVNVDLKDDQQNDFSVFYSSSSGKKASLEMKRIGPKVAVEVKEEGGAGGAGALPDMAAITTMFKQNLKYVIGAGVVLVIIILIIIVSRRKGHPEKMYRKAEGLHREGQEFHEDGDEETATELYEKAEEFREKARGLERGGD